MAAGNDSGLEAENSGAGRPRAVWIASAFALILFFAAAAYGAIFWIRYDGDRIRSRIADAIAEATGREVAIEDGVHLDFGLRPSLVVRGLRVANADWASTDAMVSIKEAEIEFGPISLLVGAPAAAEIRVDGLLLRLEIDESENLNWASILQIWRNREEKGAGGGGPRRLFDRLSGIAVRDGTLVYRRVPDGPPHRVHIRNAAVVKEEGGEEIELEAEGTFGDQAFSVEGEWGSPAALTDPAVPFPFDVALSLPPTEAALKGSFRRSGGRPRVSVELSADTVDLRPFFTGGGGKPSDGGSGTHRGGWFPSDPWPLKMLRAFGAEMQGEVKRLLLPGTAASDLRFAMALKEGVLRVDPVEAETGGGALSASFEIHARSGDSRVHLQLQESHLSELAGGSWDESPGGRLDAELQLEGKGNSAADLAATADGHLAVVFRDGRLRNRHFEWFGKDAAQVLYRLFHPGHEEKDIAQVHCGIARIDFEKGEAGVKALVVDTESTTVIGDGGVDLEKESWDLTVRRKVKEGVPGLNMDVTEWTQSFRIAGPLSRPSVSLDPTEAVWSLAKALGGMALFGPAGAAAALLDPSELAGEDPCSRALKGIGTDNGSTAEAGKRDKDDGSEE